MVTQEFNNTDSSDLLSYKKLEKQQVSIQFNFSKIEKEL